MSKFKIEGGYKLKGEITPQGAKNEVLQIICAVLLSPDEIVVKNIPNIRDVNTLIDIVDEMGVDVTRLNSHDYKFKAENINLEYLHSKEFVKKTARIRGSVMLVGPLVARFGKAYIPKPGGDKIGRRRLDTHFIGLQKLGANFNYDAEGKFYRVEGGNLQGTYMLLDEASVTGTANIIMAAVLAKGVTTIYNAACEPYIQQLCSMLNSMGADISGVGSNLLTINGVSKLSGCTHTILPDMIEIGSFIGLIVKK